jgi:hypothetical protein
MSLYKPKSEIKYDVEITKENGKVKFEFSCDGGKFGTDEPLAEYEIDIERLLMILNYWSLNQIFVDTKPLE